MKANWKIALMCMTALAMVACAEKNQPNDDSNKPSGGGGGSTPTPSGTYVSPIQINDKSIADWDALGTKVAVAELPNNPLYTGLKKIMVYADSVCINYCIFFVPAEMPSHTTVDAMHIYMDADNSDKTGGYWDQFDGPDQGNTDLMFEGPLWDDNGTPIPYVPTVSYWAGALNGEGWLWDQQETSTKIGASQFVNDSIIEGRLVIELIPWKNWSNAFSIGFDIQQNFESVGLLPQGNTPNGEQIGRAQKLLVTFDK